MAKRVTAQQQRSAAASKIVDYAEDLGHFLGGVRAKITTYNSEREQLVKHLSGLVADAQQLLTELGHEAVVAVRRRGRPAGSTGTTTGPKVGPKGPRTRRRKRRKLSAAAREKIRQAQLKRWAKVKAERK